MKPAIFAVSLALGASSICTDSQAAGYGSPIGAPFQVDADTSEFPNLGVAGIARNAHGDFVVAWTRSNTSGVYVRSFTAAGVARSAPVLIASTGTASTPGIAIDESGDVVVSWIEQTSATPAIAKYAIRVQRLSADGQRIGSAFDVSGPNPYVGGQSLAGSPSGDFVVSWCEGQRVFIPVPRLPPYGGFGYNLFFHRVYAQRYAADGTPRGTKIKIYSSAVPSAAPGCALNVAMNTQGDFVTSWYDLLQLKSGTAYTAVWAAAYSSSGAALSPVVQVSPPPPLRPASAGQVAMLADGSFTVVYSENHPTGGDSSSGVDVYAQRYLATGAPQGDRLALSQSVYTPVLASLAMDASGRFAAVWSGAINGEPTTAGVWQQWVAADGSLIGTNSRTSSDLDVSAAARAASSPDGRLVVAWTNASGHIVAQLYSGE